MNQKIIIFIKFIIVTSIFYALLAFNVFHITENLLPSTIEYIETDIAENNQDLEQTYLEIDPNIQGET